MNDKETRFLYFQFSFKKLVLSLSQRYPSCYKRTLELRVRVIYLINITSNRLQNCIRLIIFGCCNSGIGLVNCLKVIFDLTLGYQHWNGCLLWQHIIIHLSISLRRLLVLEKKLLVDVRFSIHWQVQEICQLKNSFDIATIVYKSNILYYHLFVILQFVITMSRHLFMSRTIFFFHFEAS